MIIYVVEEALPGGDWEPVSSMHHYRDPATAKQVRDVIQSLADQERAQIAYRVQMYVRRDGAVRFPGREQDWLPLTT